MTKPFVAPKYLSNPIHNEAAYEAAIKAKILAGARAKFYKQFPKAEEVVAFLQAEANKENPFDLWVSFWEGFNKYGKLSEKQVDCVIRAIQKRDAKKAEWAAKNAAENAKSNFVGNVGDKIQVKLTLTNVIEIEVPAFSYYDSGISYINLFKDEAGNIFVYRGKSDVGTKGMTMMIKASIKEHKEYNGTKQTVIQRPKLVEYA